MKIPAVATFIVRSVSQIHGHLYRILGGRGPLGKDTLLLTTRGRRSGRLVATPLYYVAEGECLYIVASFGGNDVAPHWYFNLRAHPEVKVEVGDTDGTYHARSLGPEEAKPLWPKLLSMYPSYERYQGWTARMIPIVELTPAGES